MWTGRYWKAVLLLAAGAAGGGAAYAVASVPDGNGVIHACVELESGSTLPVTTAANLRIIDPAANQHCNTVNAVGGPPPEASVDWNQAGPQGATGATGPTGPTGPTNTIAGGNTFTISGGQVITVGGGNGVTIQSPTVSSHGPALGHVSITGKPTLDFDIRGVSLETHAASSGGGKASIHDLTLTKFVDASSPKLALACANGTHFSKVTITLSKSGKTYLTYILTNALVAADQLINSSGGQAVPVEQLTFNFTKIQIQYAKQKTA
ncbi:MAG TPA: type VI secretion system tube protein Hcp [Solirubrobacteraceae bacterium]|nr:type VI secretion system tube protein Hcp [Solirubrobacteraceae bacterium]